MRHIKFKDNYSEIAAYEAGREAPAPCCYFCDILLTEENSAEAPQGCTLKTKFYYEDYPRCLKCQATMDEVRDLHLAKDLFALGVNAMLGFMPGNRTTEEEAALRDLYAGQDRQALSESDIEKLASERGEGRLKNNDRLNFHDE